MTPKLMLAAAILAACAACGRNPASPSSPPASTPPRQPLDQTVESAAYVFRYAAGDSVDDAWQQAYFAWAIAALDVQVPRRIIYNKYFSRSHMGDITGNYNTNAYAEPGPFTIHTIWPRDNHEVIHVYSSLFGSPVALFNEGFAVAHQTDPVRGDLTPRWSGTALHDWARTFRRQGTLLRIADLLATSDFRRFDSNVTYPEAGSFVRYVLDTFGLAATKRFFQSGRATDSADSVRSQFRAAYGRDVADVERDWWAMLDGSR